MPIGGLCSTDVPLVISAFILPVSVEVCSTATPWGKIALPNGASGRCATSLPSRTAWTRNPLPFATSTGSADEAGGTSGIGAARIRAIIVGSMVGLLACGSLAGLLLGTWLHQFCPLELERPAEAGDAAG